MKILFMLIMLAAAVVLTTCGRNRNDENDNDNQAPTYNGTTHSGGVILHASDAVHLSVYVPMGTAQIVRAAGEALQHSMALQGVTVYVDYEIIFIHDIEDGFNRLLSELEAGEGPDMFFVPTNFSLIPFMDNGFLTDIYALIDQSPTINRDDFFMNVLEPIKVDGRLYYLPLTFFIEHIGINTKVPPYFIERFASLDRVSVSDIIMLYMDLVDAHPEFADFALIHGLDAVRALEAEISRLVDVANRSADFSDSLFNVLFNTIYRFFMENDRFDTPALRPFAVYEEMEMLQSRYIFTASARSRGLEAVFDYEQPFFAHHVPRADERGHLILSSANNMAVSSTANPIILYFIKYYMQATANTTMFVDILDMPIFKPFFNESLETGLNSHAHYIARATANGEEQIAEIISRMKQYAEWPVTVNLMNTIFSRELYVQAMSYIKEADITARERVQRLQEYFNTWLNFDFVIEPLPVHEIVRPDDPSVRTLTIMADTSRHGGIIRQAASALNNTWAQQGRDYRFNVVVDGYTWADDFHARQARLQTELMAGRGPDMFIWNSQPMRAFAHSGFLANIYDLMDECLHTSRDDFFTQMLSAVEISGGLYMLPLSFGFHYVSINARLPQSIIDRFAALSYISISQLFELYQEVKNYSDEFGHLSITRSWNVLELRTALFSGFVDYDSRTSRLMDERFISLLENWAIHDQWDNISFSAGYPFNSNSTLRNHSNAYMFTIDRSALHTAAAFLPRNAAYFVHHIPLANEQGQLFTGKLTGGVPATWATICITTAGNSALAWEFTLYLLAAYSQPTPQAFIDGTVNNWGNRSLASPILQSMFEGHIKRALESFAGPWGMQQERLISAHDPYEILQLIENAAARIAAYNEMPIATMETLIPRDLFAEPLSQLARGLVTPRDAAQRLHNAVTLWLME